jgi:hypothetical protein
MAPVFEDRKANRPNRYKVTPDAGNAYYVTLERADEPTVLGTPLTAEVLNTLYGEDNKPTAAAIGAVTADNNRTDIPNGSDLNSDTFLKIGAWRATTVAVATSLVNCPVKVAFTFDIVAGTGFHTEVKANSGYIIQKLTTNEGHEWFRRIYAGSNGRVIDSWKAVLNTANLNQYLTSISPASVE